MVSLSWSQMEKTRKTCLVVAKCFSETAAKTAGRAKLWEVYGLCIALLPPLPVVLPHMAAAPWDKVLYFLLVGQLPRSCSIYHAYISTGRLSSYLCAFPSSSDLESFNSKMSLLRKKWLLVNASLEMLRDMKENFKTYVSFSVLNGTVWAICGFFR